MPNGILTGKDLIDAGWPEGRLIGIALRASMHMRHDPVQGEPLATLNDIFENPEVYIKLANPIKSELAAAVIEERDREQRITKHGILDYAIFGKQLIDEETLKQMDDAMRLPPARYGALMPDAHLGYGLPVGGVWAIEDAVSPWAVGVDIACRMRMTIFGDHPAIFEDTQAFTHALSAETRFGAGSTFDKKHQREHEILDDERWNTNDLTRRIRENLAAPQLGTSGTGNHFAEFVELDIMFDDLRVIESFPRWQFRDQKYTALVTHSGSRRPGYDISEYYSDLAAKYCRGLDSKLAYLPLDSEAGQEYWELMHLAGDYAAANHQVIHEGLIQRLGLSPVMTIENHHNFAWKEKHFNRNLIVHRKGATPAHKGQYGIIPGTMSDPGYVVIGKGNAWSLGSTSHGAGRKMSRGKAKKTISREDWKIGLEARGITLVGGGLDEAPDAYKDIEEVMAEQTELASVVAKFQPKIVRMASEQKRRR